MEHADERSNMYVKTFIEFSVTQYLEGHTSL